jgi:formylglycine-generating enzyme required for sulfatase activity
VVVIDQFEQWLHVNRNEAASELISALRQCDGRTIQAICLVRDDFAMAAARFMGELDVPIIQGHNFSTVDLFDRDHARKVLAKFGRAFGKVTSDPAGQASQQAFLTAAVSGLARDNRVVPVRLALFAEMIKDKPWTLSTLDEVGGTEGIGVNFLEDTFASRAANPKHRLHQNAARSVLRLLLPEAGTNIKGYMRSHEELLDASGYGERDRNFRELLGILDGELRLITPTDPEEETGTEAGKDLACKYYQLTHDYLIPSLREWLTRKQKETRKGRAELRLEEMAAYWSTKPESRHLPSLWEWIHIRLLTEKKTWTGPQEEMMRVAARVRGTHWMASLLVVVMLLGALQWYLSTRRNDDEQKRANLLVDALIAAPAEIVPYAIQNLRPLTSHVLPILRERFEKSDDPTEQVRAACALSEFGDDHVPFLLASIKWTPRRECPNIVKALRQSRSVTIQALQERANDADADQQLPFMARLAIVGLHLGDATVARDMFRSGPNLVQRTVLIDTIPTWHGSVDQWIKPTSTIEDVDFRSGICLGLGSIPVEDLNSHEIQKWKTLFQDWFQNHPNGVIHSSTGWALQRWKFPLPEIAPSSQPVEDRGWYVNGIGMTMLLSPAGTFVRQIPGPNDDFFENCRNQTVTVTQSLWMSDREVSRAQFERFIDEVSESPEEKPMDWRGAKLERSPSAAHPVQQVSWFDAVMFCNWLSGTEELTPCYEKMDSGWRLNLEANGYRLPFEAEWEHACRAGTRTIYSWGDEDSYLSKYAVCLANRTEICGSKLPNAWGLFDTHGNIREWCQDWYKELPEVDALVDPQGPAAGSMRALRGGAFDYGPTFAFSSFRRWARPDYRSFTIGFRVVRDSTKALTGAIQ